MSLQTRLDAILPALEEPAPGRGDFLRILLLDIETYPALTWQWTLWDKFTPVERIAREGGLLSIASKWYGEPDTLFQAHWTPGGYEAMVAETHARLCEADAVVTYNGDRFDLPKLRTWVQLESGLGPVSPFTSVDLFRTVRHMGQGYLSKKLDYLCRKLDLGAKVEHEGFGLWTGAMPPELGGRGDPDAQARMERYNVGDVADTLEPLYDALLPFIKGHPHVALYDDLAGGPSRCQRCGSTGLEAAGHARTPLGVYRRFQCRVCRSWHRGRTRIGTVDARAL